MPEVGVVLDLASAPARADVCIVHNDWPQWRRLTASDFSRMRRKIVVGDRRILRAEAMQGVEQGARHACRLANQE